MKRATMHRRRASAVGAAIGSVVLVTAGSILLADAARGALIPVPETGAPGRLVLAADPYPARFHDLSPGQTRFWSVQARLEDAESATLALELRKEGELVEHPQGLRMTVESCAGGWTDAPPAPSCAAGARMIALTGPADDHRTSSPVFTLDDLGSEAPVDLLISVGLDDTPATRADTTLMGLSGEFGVGLTAVAIDGDAAPPPPSRGGGNALPTTGGDASALAAVAALAAAALTAGLAMRLSWRGDERA